MNKDIKGPIPKPRRKKKARRNAKSKTPESQLQAYSDSLSQLKGIFKIRVPDLVYRLISPLDSRLQIWEKRILADAFKGLFDDWWMIQISEEYALCMPVENKSDVGKLSQGQRSLSKTMPVTICRKPEELDVIIKEFEEVAEKLRKFSEC